MYKILLIIDNTTGMPPPPKTNVMWRRVVGSVVPDVSEDRSDTKRFLQQRKSEEHLPSSIMVSACLSVSMRVNLTGRWPYWQIM